MKFARANGIDLAWESFGEEDRPAMLLVSGLGAQMIRWTDGFCAALAGRGYRVLRYDNRDAGLSTHLDALPAPDFRALAAAIKAGRAPEVPYALRDMVEDAIGLLDALSVGRAHVVGRSMGGMIAQGLASEHPGRVISLTSIMSSTGEPGLPQPEPDAMALMMRPRPDPAADPEGFAAQAVAFARRIAGSVGAFDAAAHAALALEEARRRHDPAATARQIAAMAMAGDRRERLATIRAPTLVIHGTEDPLFPLACGKATAAAIPGAELMAVEGMGHDLVPELHARIVEAIDRTARRAA